MSCCVFVVITGIIGLQQTYPAALWMGESPDVDEEEEEVEEREGDVMKQSEVVEPTPEEIWAKLMDVINWWGDN